MCLCEKKEKRREREGAICDCVVGNKWVGGGHMWV